MNKSSHSKILNEMFGELDASIVREPSAVRAVSIAKKRIDCFDDAFGGIKVCG